MKGNYQHIFTPLTVKNMTIKNRITMMPMGTNYGEQNGEMSFLHINYYEQRAKGGTGLIIVENASVDSPQGSNGTTQLRIDHDNYLPRLFKFCENIHRYGTCIAIQINHAGASAVSSRINMQPVSASDVPTKDGGDIPRPLTKEEILDIVKKYGQAAKRAQIAGFDAVEIHAGHSYLISQFLSPTTNKRTDEFGGSVENRTRFCRMVIEEVRKQVGPFFPIMLRLSADEMVEGGNTLEDTLKYLEYVQEEVDIFDVSCGLNSSIQYQIDANYMKDGWRSYMPRAVKEKFGKPYISLGNIRKFHPNLIVHATGSAPLLSPINGLMDNIDKEGGNVYSILGMIHHINDFPQDLEDKKVAVIGGGAVGLDVVEFFAARKADISIVKMMDQIGRDLDLVTKNDMKCQMQAHGVHQLTKTSLLEVKADAFLVKGSEGAYELSFSYGFVCLGMRAKGQLYPQLLDAFADDDVEIINIGDSQRARRIIDGTMGGRNILYHLTQRGYLD